MAVVVGIEGMVVRVERLMSCLVGNMARISGREVGRGRGGLVRATTQSAVLGKGQLLGGREEGRRVEGRW